jgi:HAE1 family hydrophobic/amphiphilic exporter-1
VAPPSLQGVSAFGGFQLEVLDGSGGPIEGLAQVTQQLAMKGNQSGRIAGLFTSFTANDPQLVVDIDRDRARSLGLPMSAITETLTVLLGSQYVNDFDFNNRAYRVYVQADREFRGQPEHLTQFYARTNSGQMVPLNTVVKMSETTAPAVISHFNMYRSAQIAGSAVPGVSSGEAIAPAKRCRRASRSPGPGCHSRRSARDRRRRSSSC